MIRVNKISRDLFSSKNNVVSLGALNSTMIDFICSIEPSLASQLSPDAEITFFENRIKHTERHKDDFSSDVMFEICLEDIPDIIHAPDYISIHPKKNSISFIKDYSQHVSVAVRISLDGKLSYRTMYPITDAQLQNYLNTGRAKRYNDSVEH